MASLNAVSVSKLTDADFDEWTRLFKGYVAHCQSTLPEPQFRATFDRLMDPAKDIEALVLRDSSNEGTLLAIAHFFSHAATTTEKQAMLLNDLFVDPAARRKGFGRLMLQAVIEESKLRGCFTLHWAAYHSNDQARKLYDDVAVCNFVEYRLQTGERH